MVLIVLQPQREKVGNGSRCCYDMDGGGAAPSLLVLCWGGEVLSSDAAPATTRRLEHDHTICWNRQMVRGAYVAVPSIVDDGEGCGRCE